MRRILVIAVISIMLFSGCSGMQPSPVPSGAGNGQEKDVSIGLQKLTQLALDAPKPLLPDNPDYEDKAYARAAQKSDALGISLSKELMGEDGNLLFSPLSAYLALSCISNAAEGKADKELREALYPEGFSKDEFNRANANLLGLLLNDDLKPLEIATLLCADDELALNRDFAQSAQDYYRGETASADFDAPGSKEAINAWAEEKTKGLIPEVLTKDPTPGTVCVLANSLYFSGRWQWEFNPKDTKQQTFKGRKGDVEAPFMVHEGDQYYYEDESIQACRLRFKGNSAMTVILPKSGTDICSVVEGLNSYRERMKGMEERKGILKLPRFDMDSNSDLKPVLQKLGLKTMFDKRVNSFGGLLEGRTDNPVFISEVFQKARIEVDEKGTTAAAVTVVEAPAAGAPPPDEMPPFEMIVDRPFVYIITQRARAGEAILFIGAVNDL